MSAATVPRFGLLHYQPPLSLWRLVEDHVQHRHEQQEIKRILSESLVDQSLELHEEVTTLMSIWQEFREQGTSTDCQLLQGLPEPPQQRERLIQEICFFVENVRDKAKHQGADPEKFLARHNSSVIDYALETSRPWSSRASRDRPLSTMDSRLVSQDDRQSSNICEEIQSMSHKFTYLSLDDVLQNLRHSLEEEIEGLLRDIAFLQQCLDEEHSLHSTSDQEHLVREPTLTELKEERAALEKELLTPECTIPVTPPKPKPNFDPRASLRMHSMAAVVDGSDHPHSTGRCRPGPVRAIHEINEVATQEPAHTVKSGHTVECRSPSQVSLQDINVLDKPVRIRKRTVSPSRVKVVSVGSILSPDGVESSRECAAFIPSPPTPPKPVTNRPSSADRFRKLVLECREGT